MQVLTDYFNIEKFIDIKKEENTDSSQSSNTLILQHILISPQFESQARYVVSEVMRLSSVRGLIYIRDEAISDEDPVSKRIAVKELTPVKCRRMIQYPNNIRDEKILQDYPHKSLSIITNSLITEPRLVINTRIVVVGASDVGLSFLESLVYVN